MGVSTDFRLHFPLQLLDQRLFLRQFPAQHRVFPLLLVQLQLGLARVLPLRVQLLGELFYLLGVSSLDGGAFVRNATALKDTTRKDLDGEGLVSTIDLVRDGISEFDVLSFQLVLESPDFHLGGIFLVVRVLGSVQATFGLVARVALPVAQLNQRVLKLGDCFLQHSFVPEQKKALASSC